MGTCFVIQPFDRNSFDKRYKDVIRPAIEAAGLEAYRVDEDPGVAVPIDDIERGIREADACIADISIDNPNVWFELGFAIASRKEVVLISKEGREKFPFDVQHRNVITYKTDSPQDFTELGRRIGDRLSAVLKKISTLGQLVSPLVDISGLSQHEMVALVSLAENLEGPSAGVSSFQIRQDMERAGFTKVASFLALASLLEKGLISEETETDYSGNEYSIYRMSGDGRAWLMSNQDKLRLVQDEPSDSWSEDDIPF